MKADLIKIHLDPFMSEDLSIMPWKKFSVKMCWIRNEIMPWLKGSSRIILKNLHKMLSKQYLNRHFPKFEEYLEKRRPLQELTYNRFSIAWYKLSEKVV